MMTAVPPQRLPSEIAMFDASVIDRSTSLFLLLLVLSLGVDLGAAEQVEYQYLRDVRPILLTKCANCHGKDKQEAGVRFDKIGTNFVVDRDAAQTWLEAMNAINAGEMPPDESQPLSELEQKIVTTWISESLKKAISQRESTDGRVVLRRLNRDEYQNTMTDLLGLEMDYSRNLPPDGRSRDGFRNNGRSLRMSSIQLAYYLHTARSALKKVFATEPPSQVYRHRFEKSNVGGWRGPTEKSNRLERAQKFLVKMVDDYPEQGEFLIRVRTRAELKPNKGFPLLELAIGYRPDTEVHFRVADVVEVVSEDLRQFEFRGRIENFPLPVRGQGKYPGLVLRLRNVYDDGSPIPNKLQKINKDGKERDGFAEEPHLPCLLIESVEFEGPVVSTWPPAMQQRVLFDSALRSNDEPAYVRAVLSRFMRRAFRRPPTEFEVEQMATFFVAMRPEFPKFEDALRETLAMTLIQPQFLYMLEPAGDSKRAVNDWELASRLSYFLWRTMPDDRLFDLAEDGLLLKPQVLRAEVERMLDDPRAARFTRDFVTQWLRLDGVDVVAVDAKLYPNVGPELKSDMQRETIAMFDALLRSDQSAIDLLDSDYAMLNERLARHYSIPGVYGRDFRRVELADGSHRGGLLGNAGILLANSNGHDSHPIRRAVWIRDKLLGDPPPPPPPDVPELDEADPKFASLSVREQLEVHRGKESCAGCHRGIDPWGIALENFDAVGNWRESSTTKSGEMQPVDATSVLPDGTPIEGVLQLKRYLVENRRDQFARAFVRRLLSYSLGRSLELTDEREANSLVNRWAEDGYRIRRLVHRIVLSQSFQTK